MNDRTVFHFIVHRSYFLVYLSALAVVGCAAGGIPGIG
jgi:hypothetical protein